MILNEARAKELGELFRRVGMQKIIVFEDEDPQMESARIIESSCPGTAARALYVNALVSYMLPMKGEKYWASFAYYIAKECPNGWEQLIDTIKNFTKAFHRFGVRQKLKRLDMLARCQGLQRYVDAGDYLSLWHETARCLGTQRDKKTVVFSVKMAYYGRRAAGYRERLPMEIPIPVDRRVARASLLSGIIEGKAGIEELMRKYRLVERAWGIVADVSSIPPLHLDSVLWVITSYWELPTPLEVLNRLPVSLIQRVGKDTLILLVREILFFKRDNIQK